MIRWNYYNKGDNFKLICLYGYMFVNIQTIELKSDTPNIVQDSNSWRNLAAYVASYITDYPADWYDKYIEELQYLFRLQEGDDSSNWWYSEEHAAFMSGVAKRVYDSWYLKYIVSKRAYNKLSVSADTEFEYTDLYRDTESFGQSCMFLYKPKARSQVRWLNNEKYLYFPLLIYAFEKKDDELFEQLLVCCIKRHTWLKEKREKRS